MAARNPYTVLGVPEDAAEADIRKAYRKLAKELHPDLNPGDSTAEARFKEVSAAYEILGDPAQRARFDSGEIDASGEERPRQSYYRHYADADRDGRYASSAGFEDLGDLSDFFEEVFRSRQAGGRTGPLHGADARYELHVDFLDAARGAKRRITMPDGKTLDLSIPPGVRDGETLRLRGQGAPGFNGGAPGDALVRLSIGAHDQFTRDGDDILVELPISIDEAALGAKVRTPTISGTVMLTVPPGATTGDVLRLRGKGVAAKGRPAGDQRVRLKVVMPNTIDPELAEFMRGWREKHGYDPRATKGRQG